MPLDKGTITVVVNGVPTEVEVNEHTPLKAVIPKALEQTGNTGQPPENWELKDVDGNPIDISRTIGQFHFPSNVKLFLSLKAGVGG